MGPLKKDPHGRGGRGRGRGGAGIIMSSNDVGSYEFKRSSCEMQMEECSANLARSTADGSADSELPESVICIMFRGSGPGSVQNSNSELRESVICIIT